MSAATALDGVPPGAPLWTPSAARQESSQLRRFWRWVETRSGRKFRCYDELWSWSVGFPGEFWYLIAQYFCVRFETAPIGALVADGVAGARWFPGATLNYAEHALRDADDRLAVVHEEENGEGGTMTKRDLAARVAVFAAHLRDVGVAKGDRVAGLLSNTPEAVIAFLASASLGAIWANCAPELNAPAVTERLSQLEPKVLVAAAEYRYGSRIHDRLAMVEAATADLPSLRHVVVARDRPGRTIRTAAGVSTCRWEDLPWGATPSLRFEAVPFEHPLWILFSSGTTGAPKAIVHGHGGILLEHLKVLALHLDLRSGERFFWYTSSGWMMWNLLVSGLLLPQVAIVLYDGSPKHPTLASLWAFARRTRISTFGVSAQFIEACIKEGFRPDRLGSFETLRTVGSTGSPLSADGFRWVYDHVKADVLLASISGGTDVCTAFVGSNPLLPVYPGELQCACLGAKVEAWSEASRPLTGQVGELVLTAPLPSMPVCFWNDPGGDRLRAAYFSRSARVWTHGDWIEIAAPPSRCVIHGRSDATLNRGGVRMGTAEFYQVVERIPGLVDALVVDTTRLGHNGRLLLFVALSPGTALTGELKAEICRRLRTEASPRHVPDEIHAAPAIPRTLNGKKMEIPVKRILCGITPDDAALHAAAVRPAAIDWFVGFQRKAGR